uniref:Putative cathepsin l-like proteinase n=1 Tax=Panstrongylus lignarius TaxID=156445 RepID=A0A224XFN1_9HEMI
MIMNVLITISSIFMISYISAFSIWNQEWHVFKAIHGKSYNYPSEEQFRMNLYMENKKKIEEHNRAYENGEVSFRMKMNQFGDLMSHEVKALKNGFKVSGNIERTGEIYIPISGVLPTSVDWRVKGAVTPVKDQGHCLSCWSFSATGSLEGQIYLKNGKLISLSEQNLIDCTKSYGNDGCKGGFVDASFRYIKDNKGIDTEGSYPYEAHDYTCRFERSTIGGTNKGHMNIKLGNEEDLQNAVANVGPISVTIDASQHSFHFYSGGVYHEPHCNSTSLDHCVLVVGYGTENGQDYWLVKNSWGSRWGDKGYIKMARNKDNNCGIVSLASYPVV